MLFWLLANRHGFASGLMSHKYCMLANNSKTVEHCFSNAAHLIEFIHFLLLISKFIRFAHIISFRFLNETQRTKKFEKKSLENLYLFAFCSFQFFFAICTIDIFIFAAKSLSFIFHLIQLFYLHFVWFFRKRIART